MPDKPFKELREIAEVSAVINNKANKVLKTLEAQHHNLDEVEQYYAEDIKAKEELVELLKNNADIDTILAKTKEIEEINKKEFNIVELEDIEEHLDMLNWDDYLEYSKGYAKKYDIDLRNPYLNMFSDTEKSILAKEMTEKYNLQDLDKDDTIVATTAGAIAGLIDVFLVGTITEKSSENKMLVNFTDDMFRKMVEKYAKSRKISNIEENIKRATTNEAKEKLKAKLEEFKNNGFSDTKSAIKFLEKDASVNFDAATKKQIMGSTSFEN